MKFKQIFLVILLCVGSIHSIFIPMHHPPQPNPEQQSGGCLGPINFSVEKNCRLTYASTYSVNIFDCDLNQNSDSYKIMEL